MRNPFQAFWEKVPPEDRKLIRLTVFACAGILAASLGGLYVYTAYGPGANGAHASDSTTTDSTSVPDSAMASLPPSDTAGTLLEPGESAPMPASEESWLDSFDARAHRELMRIAADKFDYTRSIAHGKRVLARYGDDPDFLAELGHSYLEGGQPTLAIPLLKKALASEHRTGTEADLALALFRSGQPDSAFTQIRTAIAQNPESPQLLVTHASMLSEIPKEQKRADSLFKVIQTQFPRFAEIRYQYGRHLMGKGDMRTAQEQLEQALQLDPLNPRAHARLGMAQFYLGKDALAERSYRTALSINPGDYNTWFNLGELYLSQANETASAEEVRSKTRAALEAYLATLAHAPNLGQAHFRIGTILNNNGQTREAIRHLEKALSSEPRSVRILLQLAAAWEKLGDRTQAVDYLETAHGIDPFHKVVATHLLRLKQNGQGNYAGAKQYH